MHYLKVVLTALVSVILWLLVVAYLALNGWLQTSIAPKGDAAAFKDAAIKIINEQNHGNVAMVLIEDGKVFAEHYAGIDQSIDRETIFSTASMSKWITAWGVMQLAAEGKVDLDAPVSRYLTRWTVPTGEFAADGVTARRLLSHTAGLTDGLGFGDYEPNETLPAIEMTLANPRTGSGEVARIEVTTEPGSEFQYSGGGYLILQLLIEEVSGVQFAEFMQRTLFDPLGMGRSTYQYPAVLDNVSRSYTEQGEVATSYQYAAAGATGFATSAGDLTTFVLQQLPGAASVLRDPLARQMRQPEASMFGLELWGLGTILYANTPSGDRVYGHDGQNEPAINSAVRINPDTGDALIVLVSGAKSLATSLGYHWVFWQTGRPDVLGTGRTVREAAVPFAIGSLLLVVLIFGFGWVRRPREKRASQNR